MAYPTELIRRARETRRMKKPSAPREGTEGQPQRSDAEYAPWRSRHGSYDQLMRSHDRVHPRHLDG